MKIMLSSNLLLGENRTNSTISLAGKKQTNKQTNKQHRVVSDVALSETETPHVNTCIDKATRVFCSRRQNKFCSDCDGRAYRIYHSFVQF